MPKNEYFNSDTREELRSLMKGVVINERAIECLRVRIARRENFGLKEAFSYCDKDQDQFLSAEDVRTMLAEHGFFATERELSFIMNKFDKDLDGRIGFAEFVEELTPKVGPSVAL